MSGDQAELLRRELVRLRGELHAERDRVVALTKERDQLRRVVGAMRGAQGDLLEREHNEANR